MHWFGKLFLNFTSKHWQDFNVQSLSILYCQCRHEIPNHQVYGIKLRFFRQHLKAAPVFCICLPSTFTVPDCRLLKDTGMHYFLRLFLWTVWVKQLHYLKQPLVLHFRLDILPLTTHVEIVALNWTCFLMFSMTDVKLANQPLDWTGYHSITASKQRWWHQAYSNFWLEFRNTYLYCVSHCIWIYNLFYLSANY